MTSDEMFDMKKYSVLNNKKSNSLWYESYRRFKKNRLGVVCAFFILFICLISLFPETLSPYSFEEQLEGKELLSPNREHLLGTDNLGRDLLSRLIYGGRISMAVGVLTALISLIFGVAYGAASGWIGGKTDAFMMRSIDILYSIPSLVLLILVKVIFDSLSFITHPELKALMGILVALSLVGWVTLARVVRGQILQEKEKLYVEAARSLGDTGGRIVFRHVLPNILGPIIVLLTLQIPSNILFESFLSFLGLGLQPPYSSWGVLAEEGWKSLRSYPHLMVAPGVAIFFTMMAFNLMGDGLRDAFDPKSP